MGGCLQRKSEKLTADMNRIHLIRTDSYNRDFTELVKLLDAELAERDGADHPFYAQYNKINMIRHVVLAHENGMPVGCGAIKEFNTKTMEIKRMYILPAYRNQGIAVKILLELENWTAELGYSKCILETGKKQPEAIGLYKKNGYTLIPNYGQYVGVDNSLCFEKQMKTH